MTGIASRGQLRMSFLRYALITVPLVLLLGLVSGRVSNSGYGNRWFDALVKPDVMPPGWTFGVAWTILYILLGLSLALVLHARGADGRRKAIGLFALQLLLNYAWSPLFFAFHEVRAALMLIVAMVVIALVNILLFARIRLAAGLLILPYLGWLVFAAWLTLQILLLNPEAESLVPGAASTNIEL